MLKGVVRAIKTEDRDTSRKYGLPHDVFETQVRRVLWVVMPIVTLSSHAAFMSARGRDQPFDILFWWTQHAWTPTYLHLCSYVSTSMSFCGLLTPLEALSLLIELCFGLGPLVMCAVT